MIASDLPPAVNVLLFALVGFIAQMIDGALGMAYGVSSNTLLLSLGLPPRIASACVHTAEMFTTAASGLSHLRLGNVNKDLVLSLIVPGVIGGVTGAYILTEVPAGIIKPIVSAYLLVMGAVILHRAFRKPQTADGTPRPILLALVGGFLDAVGGGGWGPIVTTTLVARGHEPRFMIGSVNTAEFLVTTSEAITFFIAIPLLLQENWPAIVGLLAGGVVAAPLAAYVCKRLPAKTLMIMVGVLIIVLSLRTIYLTFWG